jgi:hypothetical protein
MGMCMWLRVCACACACACVHVAACVCVSSFQVPRVQSGGSARRTPMYLDPLSSGPPETFRSTSETSPAKLPCTMRMLSLAATHPLAAPPRSACGSPQYPTAAVLPLPLCSLFQLLTSTHVHSHTLSHSHVPVPLPLALPVAFTVLLLPLLAMQWVRLLVTVAGMVWW